MSSPHCEHAIDDALRYGNALLKFLSANDAGATRSHQAGFLLPKDAWRMFTPYAPEKGRLDKNKVRVAWQSGSVTTNSVVTWYSSKQEYRLTGEMSGEFPFRTVDDIGSLFVLIPKSLSEFNAYVLDFEDDIQDIQTALQLEILPGKGWAAYKCGREEHEEAPDECMSRRFRQFAAMLTDFPTGAKFSAETVSAFEECIRTFPNFTADRRLVECIDAEYELFKLVERQVCGPHVCRLFTTIDQFLHTANSILNRRKSRAGRSLENHAELLLKDSGIPFEMRPEITGVPDIVIPGRAEYDDLRYPIEKLFVIGVKTTCKDRWRQVIEEAPRVPRKHILTLQQGISSRQLALMKRAKITLVVPTEISRCLSF